MIFAGRRNELLMSLHHYNRQSTWEGREKLKCLSGQSARAKSDVAQPNKQKIAGVMLGPKQAALLLS